MTTASLHHLPPELADLVRAAANAATSGRALALPELAGGARALAAALVAGGTDVPVLLVAADETRAAQLVHEIAFFGTALDRRIVQFPAYDVSPYESVSPSHRLVHRRMETLHLLLAHPKTTLVVASVEALLQRVVPRAFLSENRLHLAVGEEIDRDELSARLVAWGYAQTGLTEDVGDFSLRGAIVDIFPPTAPYPVRIELAGDRIEGMRTFHPANQRTHEVIERVALLPCREVVLSAETKERFALAVKDLADALSLRKARRDALAQDVRLGIYFPGIEFLLPLFYGAADTLPDYLPAGSLILVDEWTEIARRAEAFTEKARERHARCLEVGKIALPPERRYVPPGEFSDLLAGLGRLYLGVADPLLAPEPEVLPLRAASTGHLREQVAAQDVSARMLAPAARFIRDWSAATGGKTVVVAPGRGAQERMHALLSDFGLRLEIDAEGTFGELLHTRLHESRTVTILSGELRHGFAWDGARLLVLTEEDLFGEKKRRAERPRPKASQVLASFGDLEAGDFVVHQRHGIGIYRGLVALEVGKIPGEFLLIEYAGADKLYLPVDRLSMVQRYAAGDGAAPTLDRLGGTTWEKTKAKAKAGAQAMAAELLQLYAARQAQPGHAFTLDEDALRRFEATFPYEETPDQAEAIREVLRDMQGPRPMDRLVCGDVGFGKTEVALRAAFLAALSGKQTAVLVPTTTLAFQHLRTFRERLGPFGVKVSMLSRFVEPATRRRVLERLEAGEIDVVVGTHQLLGKGVRFADLGLLIIDEEQHFGVAQKERIKQVRRLVDVLTLTATPIPRTFHMSLSGIRDMSIINTPPEDRLAVRTMVTRYDEDTIREALAREFARGGQAFFIHNRVKTIDSVAARIARLVPEARMAVAHGQMDKARLEKIMVDFAEQRINLLVSTAIIESGLDFPLANTILIDRADTFGLAQLYQLRGRVGRSERRAYAYLLIPDERAITPEARKRLAVLKSFTELGSGFKIAAHDLEIRGAGNILGPEQSGNILAVGFEMYHRLLEEAILELKGQKVVEVLETEVNLRMPAYIPREYIPDEHVRLTVYKRLAEAPDDESARALADELADRFGDLPDALSNLLDVLSVKRIASALYIRSLDLGSAGLVLQFDDRTPVAPARLVELVRREPERFRLSPGGRLIVALDGRQRGRVISEVKKILHALSRPC